jgi:uncharacterized membrane protein YfcA
MDTFHYALGALSGGLVGFVLGLVGGGGSILAVPLMVYLVGVPNAHVAIGTSALAVAANAAAGLVSHARAQHVKWRCGGSMPPQALSARSWGRPSARWSMATSCCSSLRWSCCWWVR